MGRYFFDTKPKEPYFPNKVSNHPETVLLLKEETSQIHHRWQHFQCLINKPWIASCCSELLLNFVQGKLIVPKSKWGSRKKLQATLTMHSQMSNNARSVHPEHARKQKTPGQWHRTVQKGTAETSTQKSHWQERKSIHQRFLVHRHRCI